VADGALTDDFEQAVMKMRQYLRKERCNQAVEHPIRATST
jgi:hypothetical protein